jgi:hypothetical protein
VATETHDGFYLRAIVVLPDPGAGHELYLQKVDYGDEATPYTIAKQQEVAYAGSHPAKLYFHDGCVYLVEADDGDRPRTYYVRASPTEFGNKAIRET